MTKTNESGGGVWDQDLTPANGHVGCGTGAGSTLVGRTQVINKASVVRDDWDDDDNDDDEAATGDGDGKGQCGRDRVGNREEEHTVQDANGDSSRNDGSTGRAVGVGSRRYTDDDDSSWIWEEANRRTPMPELIVARASTSQSFPPPPPAALQPTLRILKRPSPNATGGAPGSSSPSVTSSSSGTTPNGSGTASPALRGTLAEREAQYQEARNRIFGEKDKDMTGTSGMVVVRDPLGPEPELDRPVKGFGERRRGKK